MSEKVKSIKFEKGFYKGKSLDEINADLVSQGYKPELIPELPNAVLKLHKHAESHILVQIEATMTLESGGKKFLMEPGDKVTIPPNVEHGAASSGNGSKYLWVEY